MRFINIIFIVIFILSAALQYNDPDPYIWIPLYLYAALVCYLSIINKHAPILYYAGLLVYVGYAIFLFFDRDGVLSWATEHDSENLVQSMKATKPWIEETREFGGLLICVAALLFNFFHYRKKIKRHR